MGKEVASVVPSGPRKPLFTLCVTSSELFPRRSEGRRGRGHKDAETKLVGAREAKGT